MPNQRANNLQQVTLVIDKSLLAKVEKWASDCQQSRNKALNELIKNAIKSTK